MSTSYLIDNDFILYYIKNHPLRYSICADFFFKLLINIYLFNRRNAQVFLYFINLSYLILNAKFVSEIFTSQNMV